MEQLKDRSKRVIENVEEKRMDMIRKWEEKSRDFIDTFLLLFGRDGRLVNCCYYLCFIEVVKINNAPIFFFSLIYGMKVKAD